MATHSATPQEDISAILERFQQWTGDQSRPAAANDPNAPLTGFQRSAHQAYTSTRQMTRELSYEEALSRARSRTRRSWEDDEFAEPVKKAAAPQASAPIAPAAPAAEAKAKAPAAASHSKSRKPQKTAAERSTMKTATPSTPARSSQTRKNTAPATSAPTHRKAKAAASTKKKKAAAKAPVAGPAARKPEASATQSTAPQTVAYDLQPASSFQQILAAQMKTSSIPAPATVTEVMPEPTTVHAEEISGTSVSVTVHLSVTERNALRTRAQQLGLTADAYLRQCALEVESLRSELQEMLVTRMQAARQLPAQPRRDWLGRLKQYFFPARTDCQTQIFHA